MMKVTEEMIRAAEEVRGHWSLGNERDEICGEEFREFITEVFIAMTKFQEEVLVEPKLCKDCQYYGAEGTTHRLGVTLFSNLHHTIRALCGHPKAPHSLVDGFAILYCDGCRDDNNYCGPEAKWFEAKDE